MYFSLWFSSSRAIVLYSETGFIVRIFYAKMYKLLTPFLKGPFGIGHISIGQLSQPLNNIYTLHLAKVLLQMFEQLS